MYLPPEYPALLDLDVADQLRVIAVDLLDAGLPDVYVGILVSLAARLEATLSIAPDDVQVATRALEGDPVSKPWGSKQRSLAADRS